MVLIEMIASYNKFWMLLFSNREIIYLNLKESFLYTCVANLSKYWGALNALLLFNSVT